MCADKTTSRAFSWLTDLQYRTNQSDVLSNRHGNTGIWFLQTSEFQSWISDSGNTLLCPGIPGSGKTVLVSITVQSLLDQFKSQQESIAIIWVYCNFRSRDSQTTNNLIACIVKTDGSSETGLGRRGGSNVPGQSLQERECNPRRLSSFALPLRFKNSVGSFLLLMHLMNVMRTKTVMEDFYRRNSWTRTQYQHLIDNQTNS